jgi:hypothetical protein
MYAALTENADTVYPWNDLGKTTIVDLGGGIGSVSMALLKSFPQLSSIIQDRPEAVTNGRRVRPILSVLTTVLAGELSGSSSRQSYQFRGTRFLPARAN